MTHTLVSEGGVSDSKVKMEGREPGEDEGHVPSRGRDMIAGGRPR